MLNANNTPPCDRCDRNVTKGNPPTWNKRQQRLLDAYRERPIVARAARLAGVHRATVYRWMADVAFADAMQVAADEYDRDRRAKALAAEAAARPQAAVGRPAGRQRGWSALGRARLRVEIHPDPLHHLTITDGARDHHGHGVGA